MLNVYKSIGLLYITGVVFDRGDHIGDLGILADGKFAFKGHVNSMFSKANKQVLVVLVLSVVLEVLKSEDHLGINIPACKTLSFCDEFLNSS